MEQNVQLLAWTIVLCTDSSAAVGLVKRKGASPRTRHVDTKVYLGRPGRWNLDSES